MAVVLVAGCTDAAQAPAARVTIDNRAVEDVIAETPVAPQAPDVCALAAELPTDNICSLVCDPDAIKARLVEQGAATGTCYEMRCALPGLTVQVGVCLLPS